jgi:hypothetical protein
MGAGRSTHRSGTQAMLEEIASDHDVDLETVQHVLGSVYAGWRPQPQHMFFKLASDLRWHIHRGNIRKTLR